MYGVVVAGQLSAGILAYRGSGDDLQVLIAHPGGPFWANKDEGAWSLPKGLVEPGEDRLAAAIREFAEETGCVVDDTATIALGEVTLRSGKRVVAFAAEVECDPELAGSNHFEMEWPPRSGRMRSFPEVDRVAWVGPGEARIKLNPAQAKLVDRLVNALSGD